MQPPKPAPPLPDPTAWEPFAETPDPLDNPLYPRLGAWAGAGMILLTIVRGKRGDYRAVWRMPDGGFLTAFDAIDPLFPDITGPGDAQPLERVYQLIDEFEADNGGDRVLSDRQAVLLRTCLREGLR